MADVRAPNRGRGRGRNFDPKGGRGGPKGGNNAVELILQPPRDGGSPMASHLSTLNDANSTNDDTIDTFVKVRPSHYSFHSITVRQKHVENVCGVLDSQNLTKTLIQLHTAVTSYSLADHRRYFLIYNTHELKTPT
jgi:hypothetical protein